MLKLILHKKVQKFLQGIPEKHKRQIALKIMQLKNEGHTSDSIHMKGSSWHRADSGEYRIIYAIEEESLIIVVVGKRNDGDVYSQVDRLNKQLLSSILKK